MARMDPTSHRAGSRPNPGGSSPLNDSNRLAGPPPPPQPPPSSPLASFAAEMFVWLWFAPPPSPTTEPKDSSSGGGQGGSGGANDADRMRMQFAPNPRFVMFCHDVLTTTQVSHSVVLLALLFVSRLKQKNSIRGAPGSEFRLAVTGLMLANKVLDDNTYTARTWSQVSSLELKPLVEGEAEFLKGLNWSLHVTEREFRSFLKLLEGHVAARNQRIGGSRGGVPRKIASTSRVRRELEKPNQAAGGAGPHSVAPGGETIIGSDGITNPILFSYDHLLTTGEDERNVRRRLAGSSSAAGVTMSATSTPTMGFGTFSLPLAAPTSAPHVQPQPLSSSGGPVPMHHSSSDTVTTTRPNSASSDIYRSSSMIAGRLGIEAGGSAKKRNLDEMAKPLGFPALPHLLVPPPMSRSQSSSAAFSSSTPAYTPTASSSSSLGGPTSSPSPLPLSTSSTPLTTNKHHGTHSAFPHPLQLATVEKIHQSFETLADRFSPRYDPRQPVHRRLSSLDYYSLAAGQGQGRLHQVPPPRPVVATASSPRGHPHAYALPGYGYGHGHPVSAMPAYNHPSPAYHIPAPQARPAGGSLASSPTYPTSSRPPLPIANYAPAKPSVLSGLRSSPPSNEAISSSSIANPTPAASRRPSQVSAASHPLFSHTAPALAQQQQRYTGPEPSASSQSRRQSHVSASSPGFGHYSVDEGTSTPTQRPSTGGSTSTANTGGVSDLHGSTPGGIHLANLCDYHQHDHQHAHKNRIPHPLPAGAGTVHHPSWPTPPESMSSASSSSSSSSSSRNKPGSTTIIPPIVIGAERGGKQHPWSAYANAGPPGVYWAAAFPHLHPHPPYSSSLR
ncbi:hypothetical protein JCM3766R1_006509 [Sporobolomyces carnicolor]